MLTRIFNLDFTKLTPKNFVLASFLLPNIINSTLGVAAGLIVTSRKIFQGVVRKYESQQSIS